jgi:hypothetical protein
MPRLPFVVRCALLSSFSCAAVQSSVAVGAALPPAISGFVAEHCADCHDGDEKKGGLDFATLAYAPDDPRNLALWVKIHDRVSDGEMPPKKRERPPPEESHAFLNALSATLTASEQAITAREGRATRRRLNRYEYENALRDLLHAPWLQIRDALPEDGERFRFNKIGDALDVSHVQMARYLAAAEYALRQVAAHGPERPPTKTTRYYAREQRSFTGPMKFSVFNTSPERATFPVLGTAPQPEVRAEKAPLTVGAADPATRELEGVGVVQGSYEPLEPKFNQFRAPVAGRYKLRFNALSVWVGPTKQTDPKKPDRWWIPDLDNVAPGRRSEPITVYSETPPRQLRRLGTFDVTPEPSVHELEVWLLAGETIRPDAARLFRSRPAAGRWQNPLAEKDGQPGVVFRWLEVEGPLLETWPTAGHTLLFGDLPLRKPPGNDKNALALVATTDPAADAAKLLRTFLAQAYRHPVDAAEVQRFLPVVQSALQSGSPFAEAMLSAYTAVLCSPEFVCIEEKPGRLDDHALASRLAFFLTNSAPDAELRTLAGQGKLHAPAVLRAQTDRLLAAPESRRFVDAFLDYWLDLRRIVATAPDSTLYPDYYLDDLLEESALDETQLFFAELLRENLPARNLIASDFAIVNERLAAHYGLAPVEGVALHRVPLPADSVRGGLLTQAAVLKVTANGTTTSPVLRGAWVMERILGQPSPPPPPSVPAIEPDIRGATTIRQILDQHRHQESCAVCHVKIDPAGFALENFDVMGGWRDRYRAALDNATATNAKNTATPAAASVASAPAPKPEPGLGKGGQKFAFRYALPVDASGELPDGRKFSDIRDLKKLLLTDERAIARNLARQLVVYATGAPVRFSDRAEIERILDRTAKSHYGVHDLVQSIVQSELFLKK